MSASTWWCRAGDGPLVESLTNGMHQTCDACHGFAVTIWLLDEMLVEGRGGQIWRAATAAPVTGDGCPSCRPSDIVVPRRR